MYAIILLTTSLLAQHAQPDLVRQADEEAHIALRQAVMGIPTEKDLSLRDTLAARGLTADALNDLISRAIAAAPRFYSSGACEVRLRLPREAISNTLQKLQISAAAASEMQYDLLVSGLALPFKADVHARTDASRDAAIEAAKLDARLGLVDRIRRLRIGPSLTVADLLADEPRLGWLLPSALDDIQFDTPQMAAGLTCRITARISPAAVTRVLERLAAKHYAGTLVSIEAIRQLPALNSPDDLSVRGSGLPPPAAQTTSEYAAPSWSERCLTATGAARLDIDQAGRPDAILARARDMARIDAARNLARAIDALALPSGHSMREWLLAHPQRAHDLELFLENPDLASPPKTAGGNVTIEFMVPARALWHWVADDKPSRSP